MRRLLLSVVTVVIFTRLLSVPAAADLQMGWRSPYGTAYSVSVNATDSSCWAGTGTSVVHVSAQGVLLSQTRGFVEPVSVSANSQDGSCWVADQILSQVVKLGSDGKELLRLKSYQGLWRLSVNPTDGSCWLISQSQIVHVAADGTELWRGGTFTAPTAISANSHDGSCWVADFGSKEVVHLSAQGNELFRGGFINTGGGGLCTIRAVAVNPVDGSCWVGTDPPSGFPPTDSFIHIAADGTQLHVSGGSIGVSAMAVNAADSTCWVVDGGLLHMSVSDASSSVTFISWAPTTAANDVAVNPLDGSIWTAEPGSLGLVHRSQFGVLLGQVDIDGVAHALGDVGDGSFWVGIAGTWDAGQGKYIGGSVQRLTADGRVLAASTAFQDPRAIGVIRADGSCWAADAATGDAVRLSATGGELARIAGFDGATGLCVDPYDHTVWVADTGHSQVAHLGASGVVLSRSDGFAAPASVSVYTSQSGDGGDCWVADTGNNQLVQLDRQGKEVSRTSGFSQPASVSASEGRVWVADTGNHRVVRTEPQSTNPILWSDGSFTAPSAVGHGTTNLWAMDSAGEIAALGGDDGHEFWRGPVSQPTAMAVNGDYISNSAWPDSSVWVASGDQQRVYHYGAEGSVEWNGLTFAQPMDVSAYRGDGSCWVADYAANRVLRIAWSGMVLAQTPYVEAPGSIATNQADGSAWVTSTTHLSHIAPTGEILASSTTYTEPGLVDYNSHDNTFWMSNREPPEVVHFAADGTQLSIATGFSDVLAIAASPHDDSCWAADPVAHEIVHVASDGHQIAKLTGYTGDIRLAADPVDGSIWVTQTDASVYPPKGTVSHLAADGTVLWSGAAFQQPVKIVVDGKDRSAWLADAAARCVIHLAADGTELWRSTDFAGPLFVSLDAANGSLWISDPPAAEVTHLVAGPFSDISSDSWAAASIDACVKAGIVSGYPDGSYQPTNPVTRDQMAIFISRALAGGDAAVPAAPATASFTDVPTDYWAFKYVEYAKSKNIVAGYPDGLYHPTDAVDRGQMAIFIARAIVSPTGDAGLASYTPPTTPSFPDVATGYYAYKYIEFIKSKNITGGYPDGNYHPTDTVTRDQMAVYVARAFGLE